MTEPCVHRGEEDCSVKYVYLTGVIRRVRLPRSTMPVVSRGSQMAPNADGAQWAARGASCRQSEDRANSGLVSLVLQIGGGSGGRSSERPYQPCMQTACPCSCLFRAWPWFDFIGKLSRSSAPTLPLDYPVPPRGCLSAAQSAESRGCASPRAWICAMYMLYALQMISSGGGSSATPKGGIRLR